MYNQSYQDKLQENEIEIGKIQQSLKSIQQLKSELSTQNDKLKNENQLLKNDLTEIKKKISSLNQEKQKINIEIKQLQNQWETKIEQEHIDFEARISELNEKLIENKKKDKIT